MATAIEVIIFTGTIVAARLTVETVALTAGLTMIPVTAELTGQLDPAAGGADRIPPGWALRQPVAALARSTR